MTEVTSSVGSLRPEVLVRFTAKESVTVFDWDDTLFASTHAEVFCGQKRSAEDQEEFAASLEALEKVVLGLLKRATRIGRVFIVTNATMDWVRDVCQCSMPLVGKFLQQHGIHVVSARDLHEGTHPESPLLWKLRAFKDILSVVRSISGEVRNFMVIGDGREEHEAARQLRSSEHDMFVKMVKLPNVLPIEKLVRHLALLSMSYQNIWSAGRHFELEVD